MKGTNTLILNNRQMLEILNKWWSDFSYNNKDKIMHVTEDSNGNFEITIDEVIEIEEE